MKSMHPIHTFLTCSSASRCLEAPRPSAESLLAKEWNGEGVKIGDYVSVFPLKDFFFESNDLRLTDLVIVKFIF